MTIACRYAATLFPAAELESQAPTMKFGEVTRHLVAMKEANFINLAACCKDLGPAGDRHARTYTILRARLNVTFQVGARVASRTLARPAQPSLQQAMEALARLESPDHQGLTRLMSAAGAEGDLDRVRTLVTQGADIHRCNSNGMTALAFSAYAGHAAIVQYLVDMGARIDVQCADGFTALMRAVIRCHENVVKILLSAGADPTIRSAKRATALHHALRKGHQPIIGLLEEAGTRRPHVKSS